MLIGILFFYGFLFLVLAFTKVSDEDFLVLKRQVERLSDHIQGIENTPEAEKLLKLYNAYTVKHEYLVEWVPKRNLFVADCVRHPDGSERWGYSWTIREFRTRVNAAVAAEMLKAEIDGKVV